MHFLAGYLKQRRKSILAFLVCCGIFLISFALYRLPLGAVIYPALLCALLWAVWVAADLRRVRKKHERLQNLGRLPAEQMQELPAAESMDEADYQEILRRLCRDQAQLQTRMNDRYREAVEYFTVWVHQIKTPIASIRLNQQKEDSEFSRLVAEDLQRIEQYVEMVLTFFRLDSESTDYVFRSQELDGIVRPAVRKFSAQFIRRKIQLEYEPLELSVVTDEKWLGFVVEQVLSNALKYTPAGSIRIFREGQTLCIRDTGIGIAPEDLPRIFEKGYTGYNGRGDKRSSGLGLYLCRRICGNLGHTITAESVPGEGTIIRIDLSQRITKPE